MIVLPKRYFLRTVPRECVCVHTYASVYTMNTLMPQLFKRFSGPALSIEGLSNSYPPPANVISFISATL